MDSHDVTQQDVTKIIPQDNQRLLTLFTQWLIAFSANMIVPLIFGLSETHENGRDGLWFAVASLFAIGLAVCMFQQRLATTTIIGSVVVGLSQLFPILQIIAGVLAFGMTDRFGLRHNDALDSWPRIYNESSGFVVTFVTGSLLILASLITGALIRLNTPSQWWTQK